MDGKTPVADVVAKAGKDAGTTIVLKDYVRFQLGEGIEKEESDFAAEVAAAVGRAAARRIASRERAPGSRPASAAAQRHPPVDRLRCRTCPA